MKVLIDTVPFSGQAICIYIYIYIIQEDNEIEGYTLPITAYACEIVFDAAFLSSVSNAKFWYTPMKTGVGDVTVILKQVSLPNITMMKIDKIKPLPKL